MNLQIVQKLYNEAFKVSSLVPENHFYDTVIQTYEGYFDKQWKIYENSTLEALKQSS